MEERKGVDWSVFSRLECKQKHERIKKNLVGPTKFFSSLIWEGNERGNLCCHLPDCGGGREGDMEWVGAVGIKIKFYIL